nr:hypothetical protein MACL_00003708 [Theileria orientalis]
MASTQLISKNSIDLTPEGGINVYEVVWNLLKEDRQLLYDLFEALRSIERQRAERPAKKNEEPRIDTGRLEDLLDRILAVEPRLQPLDPESIVESLLKVERNPPDPLPCHFQAMLLDRAPDGVTLRNHDKVSLILSFLDVDSLLSLSLTSKSCHYAVVVHMNKELYHLPFNREPVCTNLNSWKNVIDFFFNSAGRIVPIDRLSYPPLSKQMNAVKSLFPISSDSILSHTYVTFDSIKPHLIVYCDHDKPMSHTCSSSKALDWDNKATTKLISCSEFIMEYMQRLEVRDDQFVWGFGSDSISPKFICFLLKCYLDSIVRCLSKHEGEIEFRKTEFIANAKHSIVHRIWIQLSLKWDFRFGPQPQNSLYLTIADHFKLDV